jgi:hypothetical protein
MTWLMPSAISRFYFWVIGMKGNNGVKAENGLEEALKDMRHNEAKTAKDRKRIAKDRRIIEEAVRQAMHDIEYAYAEAMGCDSVYVAQYRVDRNGVVGNTAREWGAMPEEEQPPPSNYFRVGANSLKISSIKMHSCCESAITYRYREALTLPLTGPGR